jgi:hypothetical protein
LRRFDDVHLHFSISSPLLSTNPHFFVVHVVIVVFLIVLFLILAFVFFVFIFLFLLVILAIIFSFVFFRIVLVLNIVITRLIELLTLFRLRRRKFFFLTAGLFTAHDYVRRTLHGLLFLLDLLGLILWLLFRLLFGGFCFTGLANGLLFAVNESTDGGKTVY